VVRPVSQVLFRAPLVEPPARDRPRPNARKYYVLNDDVYGNF